LRWLKTLVDEGVCIRRPDERDSRRIYVELTPNISNALRRYVAEAIETAPFRNALPGVSDLLKDPPAPHTSDKRDAAKR
jgi:DNA-binding MarR family transcriptional regulator